MPNHLYHLVILKILTNQNPHLPGPNDGHEHHDGFPGLVDWITLLEGDSLDPEDQAIFINILKVHYKIVIYTISNAIRIIDEVHVL